MSTHSKFNVPDEVGDLRRGAGVHLGGHLARAAHPALLAATTYLFGAERWGLLVAAQAALLVLSRVALTGYDRALVYWLPREDAEPVVSAALLRVGLRSTLLAVVGALIIAPALAIWKGAPAAPWVVLSFSLAPITLIDLLAYAATGVRRMEVMVMVRDVLVPFLFFLMSWVFFAAGIEESGLAWAFVLSQVFGAVAAFAWSRRLIPMNRWGRAHLRRLPHRFEVYARDMWGAELAAALLYRADALALAVFASPRTLGLYGIALQFGNTVRSLRGAFDPMVTAVASGLSNKQDRPRLRDSLTYTTTLVLACQLMFTGFVVCFGPVLLPLFGAGFDEAYPSAVLLCVGWTLHGSVGLAGPLVMGLGMSRWTLISAVTTLACLLLLLAGLVPSFGMEGAAASVAIAFVGQAVAHHLLARRLLEGAVYTPAIRGTLGATVAALGVGAVAFVFAQSVRVEGVAPAVAFVSFLAIMLPFALIRWKTPTPGGPELEAAS